MDVATHGANAKALMGEWKAFLLKNKITGLPAMPSTKRWQLKGLAEKKLFYWSSRFSSYSAAGAFARATAAMEAATRKGAPIYGKKTRKTHAVRCFMKLARFPIVVLTLRVFSVNFNNFAGRGYVPGPVGNNRNKTDPDAAMLSLDW